MAAAVAADMEAGVAAMAATTSGTAAEHRFS